MQPRTSLKGIWLVLVLLAAGLGAALTSMWYWSRVEVEIENNGAGSVPFDESNAQDELQGIRDRYSALREAGKIDQAIRSLRRLMEKYPRYAAVRTHLGLALSDARHFDGAYEQLERSLELDNHQSHVHLLAGTIAMNLNNLKAAARHYSQAVGLEPKNGEFRVHLAQVQIEQHQYSLARLTLLEALRIDSSLHEAYFSLANLYARDNKLILALSQIQKAIENVPVTEHRKQVPYILFKAKLLRRKNRPEESLQTLRSLPPETRGQISILEDMAISWQLLGRPADGAELYEQQMNLNPSEWRLVAGAAHWRIKAGDKERARMHLATIKRLNPLASVTAELEKKLEAADTTSRKNPGKISTRNPSP